MHVLTKQIQRRLSFLSSLYLSPVSMASSPSLALWQYDREKADRMEVYYSDAVVSLWPDFACDRLPLKNDPMRAKFYASKWAKANIKFRTPDLEGFEQVTNVHWSLDQSIQTLRFLRATLPRPSPCKRYSDVHSRDIICRFFNTTYIRSNNQVIHVTRNALHRHYVDSKEKKGAAIMLIIKK